MKIAQLREVMRVYEQQCREDGKPEQAEALAQFSKALLSDAPDTETVNQFVQRIEKARQKAGK